MGLAKAREMLVFGEKITGTEALAVNIVSRLADPGTVAASAEQFARGYAATVEPAAIAHLEMAILGGADAGSRGAQMLALLADTVASQSEVFRPESATLGRNNWPARGRAHLLNLICKGGLATQVGQAPVSGLRRPD